MNKNIEIKSCIKHKEITISYLDINNYLLLKLFTSKGRRPIYKKVIMNKTGKECINLFSLSGNKYIVELKGANFKQIEEVAF